MNRKLLTALLAFIGLIILVNTFITKKEDREPIIITAYSSYESMSLDALIAESDIIIVGTADFIRPSRWNTPDGKLPKGTTIYSITSDKIIFTDVDFNINQVIKGEKEQSTVKIRSLGGVVEQDQMITEDVLLEIGKNYLLFLSQDTQSTESLDPVHYWTFGHQGVYEVANGRAISVKDEWVLEELIAHIEKSLSGEVSLPTLIPADAPTSTP